MTVRQEKRSKKEKQKKVLLGLIEHFVAHGRPVGSHTLQETVFPHLSSATLRNYFSELEEEGFLTQQHTSGGRLPTCKAWRFYAKESLEKTLLPKSKDQALFSSLSFGETKEISKRLILIAEKLSKTLRVPVFFSYPRFDQEYVTSLKFIALDSSTYLIILVTDFGTVKTEVLHLDKKLSSFSLKRIEQYFQWRVSKTTGEPPLSAEEKEIANTIYQETVLRYAVSHSVISEEEVYRTGFLHLLHLQDEFTTVELAQLFEFLEAKAPMKHLLRATMRKNERIVLVESDLFPYSGTIPKAVVFSQTYSVQRQPVGAFGLIAPLRMSYNKALSLLGAATLAATDFLTKSVYRYQLSWRVPEEATRTSSNLLTFDPSPWILENQSKKA